MHPHWAPHGTFGSAATETHTAGSLTSHVLSMNTFIIESGGAVSVQNKRFDSQAGVTLEASRVTRRFAARRKLGALVQ